MDFGLCNLLFPSNPGARWFLLHALGNMVVALAALPDFYNTLKNAPCVIQALRFLEP